MRWFLTVFLLATTVASAQFSFPAYKPSECQATATELAIQGITDGKVVAVACVGYKVPILGTELYLGIDMVQGTAPVWFYVVRSESRDSVAGVALIRPGGTCTTPPIEDIPDATEDADVGTEPIPNGFLEGSALVSKIAGNAQYQAFHAAHADSMPTAGILTVSEVEVAGYPVGTPFWMFLWAPADQTSMPFACYVHAITGETICLGGTTEGVFGDVAKQAGYSVFPNPGNTITMLNVPLSMLGKQITVQATDVTGRTIVLSNDIVATVPMVLNTSQLSTGMWSLLVTAGTTHQVVPLIINR